VDYVIRDENAATALRTSEEVISDTLLIAMVLKGLPSRFKTFSAIIVQQDKREMTFDEFQTALRRYEESERSRSSDTGENVMLFKHNEKFEGTCFKCGKKGHKKSDCWSKSEKTGNYSGAKFIKRSNVERTPKVENQRRK
jgi:hypothetical protein